MNYPAFSGKVPPLEWDNDALFVSWKPRPGQSNKPDITFKPVRAAVMKGRFTSRYRDSDIEYDHTTNTRFYWNSAQGKPMTEKMIRKFIDFSENIYKCIDDVWVCVFDWESPAAHEFYNGNLTVRELRDSIEW